MIVNTHYALAKAFHWEAEVLTGETINKNSFIYGNIIPDIDKSTYDFDHRFTQAGNFINELVQELATEWMDEKEFSRKLGILCHFLVDCFCQYHFYNALWKTAALKHMVYETKLHYHLSELNYQIPCMRGFAVTDLDIARLFHLLSVEYTSQKTNTMRDLAYGACFIKAVLRLIGLKRQQSLNISRKVA